MLIKCLAIVFNVVMPTVVGVYPFVSAISVINEKLIIIIIIVLQFKLYYERALTQASFSWMKAHVTMNTNIFTFNENNL